MLKKQKFKYLSHLSGVTYGNGTFVVVDAVGPILPSPLRWEPMRRRGLLVDDGNAT